MLGVPQYSVLATCLFLFYIDDVAQSLNAITRPIADNNDLHDHEEMNAKLNLDLLHNWKRRWIMEFHPAKCEVISITHRRTLLPSSYFFHEQQLKRVYHTRYLGIIITTDLH